MLNTSPELNFEPSADDLTILDIVGVAPTYIESAATGTTSIFTTGIKDSDREMDT